jgi:hypothetical protein
VYRACAGNPNRDARAYQIRNCGAHIDAYIYTNLHALAYIDPNAHTHTHADCDAQTAKYRHATDAFAHADADSG